MAILCKVLNVGQEKKIEYTVNSDQIGADVYFNDKFVGKVPNNGRLVVTYKKTNNPISVRMDNIPSKRYTTYTAREFNAETLSFILNGNRYNLPISNGDVFVDIQSGVLVQLVGKAVEVAVTNVSPTVHGTLITRQMITRYRENTDIFTITALNPKVSINYKPETSVDSESQSAATYYAYSIQKTLGGYTEENFYIDEGGAVYGIYTVIKETVIASNYRSSFYVNFGIDWDYGVSIVINRPS